MRYTENNGIGYYRWHFENPVLDFWFLNFKFRIFRNFDFWFLIYDFWFLTCEFWILVSEFWFLISDFKYRVNYSLKIRYSVFINRKLELDYFHFVVFWILDSGKQDGRKASWLVHLSLQDVLFGISFKPCPLLNLLNYFIIIGKLFIWDCRWCQIRPKIQGFRTKISIKYETESKIKKQDYLKENWVLIPI